MCVLLEYFSYHHKVCNTNKSIYNIEKKYSWYKLYNIPYQVIGQNHCPHWRLAVSSYCVYGGHHTMHRSKLLDPTMSILCTSYNRALYINNCFDWAFMFVTFRNGGDLHLEQSHGISLQTLCLAPARVSRIYPAVQPCLSLCVTPACTSDQDL